MVALRLTKSLILVAAACCLLVPQGGYAKKMYRWVDENGKVFFSDQVPQDQIQHKRESLNDQARVIGVVEEAKTKEQIELEIRLKKLRWEQQKIIEKQKSHDKVLLSTFRSVNDLQLALNGKLAALNAQRKVAEGNRVRLELQLEEQQNQAAEIERSGRKVPQALLDKIAASKEQISFVDKEIERHLEQKSAVQKEFHDDIERFVFLTQSKVDAVNLSNKTAEDKAADELGLFNCVNADQCLQAWDIARLFLEKHSTTGVDIDTDKLIMRAPPMGDDDLSLSVSRFEQDKESGREKIFLDIRCRKSTLGIELCASPAVKQIRQSFNRFINSNLATQ